MRDKLNNSDGGDLTPEQEAELIKQLDEMPDDQLPEPPPASSVAGDDEPEPESVPRARLPRTRRSRVRSAIAAAWRAWVGGEQGDSPRHASGGPGDDPRGAEPGAGAESVKPPDSAGDESAEDLLRRIVELLEQLPDELADRLVMEE